MNTKFLNQKINIKDLTPDSVYNPYLIGNNEKQIGQICDFLQNDKKLLLINGFAGSGKGEILGYVTSFLKLDVVFIKYMCLETTILDDMLLSFFESFRNYAIKGTINLPKGKVDNFTQKINSYFNAVKNPVIVVLHSFQSVLKENKKDIMSFIEHLEKFENVKIILSSRTFNYEEFDHINYDRISVLAFTKDYFEKYLKNSGVKNIGPLSNELYKQTKGYYNLINLSLIIMQLRKYSLVKFLEIFSKSAMPFSEFIRKEALMLVDPVSLHLFRLLALMRIPIKVNLIKSLHLFNQEKIYFFVQNHILSVDGENLYLKDFYREIIEQQIQQSVMIKLHKACIDLYETQLPLKPLERDLRLSRQTMRNEIDYHSLFIPKKPQIQTQTNLAQFVQPLTPNPPEIKEQIIEPDKIKEESKEEKIEKINFIFEDEKILDNIASSINNFIRETKGNKEIALNSSKMSLIDILNQAKVEESKYNYKHAVLLYQSALNKTEDENFDKFLPVIYEKLAQAYKHLSDWHNALEYYTKLQDHYFNVSQEEKAWEIQLEMANIYFSSYKQDNAKYILHELDKKNLPNDLRIKVYLTIAKITDNINEEFTYYQKSIKLINSDTDKSVLAQLYYRIAGIFDEKDEIKKAAFYYKKCIEIKNNNNYLSRAMANLAELYDESGKTDFAIKYYEKSIEIDKEMKNYNGLYSSTRHLSEIYSSKNSSKSLEYLNQAYYFAKKLNEPYYITDLAFEIGNYYLLRKDFDNAYKYFILARNTAKISLLKDNEERFDSKLDYIKKYTSLEEYKELENKYGK